MLGPRSRTSHGPLGVTRFGQQSHQLQVSFGRGREGVGRNLANAATKYSDGEVLGVERVATYASGDIACFVEVEHIRAKLGDGPVTDVRARATTIYERRDGGWNLVHRHADPITTPRSAESLLAS